MADLSLRLEVRLTRNTARWGMVAFLMAFFAPELGSENVVLTTYYPAPSGIYTKLITTENTHLARNGSTSVIIGADTTAANGSTRLVVMNGRVGIGTNDPQDLLHLASGNSLRWGSANSQLVSDQGGSVELGGNNSTAGNGSPYIDFHRTGGGVQDYNVRLINDGAGRVSYYSYSGRVGVYAGGSFIAGEAGCNDFSTNYPSGFGNSAVCAGGQYATLSDGFMSKKVIISEFQNANVTFRCCNCPPSGCPSF